MSSISQCLCGSFVSESAVNQSRVLQCQPNIQVQLECKDDDSKMGGDNPKVGLPCFGRFETAGHFLFFFFLVFII